ncbi:MULTISPECIES: GNAT family N-acetyltransferase [unclassified Gordonia (in: high G+C Gram-positive bacteria)]|uniref:GNAT family N-acetyltransferase n=1 Tax=unclassified Gordonia (in: high G+C Gram-positive bacteria) TaxID=2657482 RepID=UPI0009AEA8EE|nr:MULTISPECIES: GNAT family N-acetyltransferase [unclassified Gordonia (in: high G+C Gram-positive bacteria)]MDF3285129.1 GNAT family N-acetyltransferase [Gordonia sp. N1V]OPX08601.1 GNAT family N-acetyltransferase [Gordonia sp. i37]
MTVQVRPATHFDDVATMVGPKRPDANVCWCLSYRIPNALNRTLAKQERGHYVRKLCAADPPPGVLAYLDDEVVGWAAIAPRAETTFATNRRIPHVDDLDVWSLWCVRIRPGYRKTGLVHPLIAGAVEFARDRGAPAVEAYPVDNRGARVDLTMAYVGTRAMFETAGFVKASDTTSVLNGFPRIIMRLPLG